MANANDIGESERTQSQAISYFIIVWITVSDVLLIDFQKRFKLRKVSEQKFRIWYVRVVTQVDWAALISPQA